MTPDKSFERTVRGPDRAVLLFLALLVLGVWGVTGPHLSMCCPKPSLLDSPEMIMMGIVFSAPFWIPAIIPGRFMLVLRAARWLGVLGAVSLAGISAYLLHFGLQQSMAPSFILGVTCFLVLYAGGAAVLLRSELRRQ